MKVNKSKEELYEILEKEALDVIVDNTKRSSIKKYLQTFNIEGFISEKIFNDVNNLDDYDVRITVLYTKAIFEETKLLKLAPEEWFTELEIKDALQFLYQETEDSLNFPFLAEKVLKNSEDSFTTNFTIKQIALFGINHMTYFNPDIQREGKREMRNGEIVIKPKIYQKNVQEIKKLILDGKLEETTLVFNVPLGITGLDNDVFYDEKKMQLTINEGARLDIVDGIHRTLACQNAYIEDPTNPFLDTIKLTVKIFNYDTARAQNYQAQLAKATPIQKSRIKELEKARLADIVVRNLKINNDSDLKDKISSSNIPNKKTGELTSYSTLSDAIDNSFGDLLKKQFDTIEVTKYLKEFYTYLFGLYEDQLNDKDNILFSNKIFFGHIVLARYMKDNEIPFEEMKKYIKPEDFNKETLHESLKKIIEMRKINYKKLNQYYLEVFGI